MTLDFIRADIESYIKKNLKYAVIEILNQYIENEQRKEWRSICSYCFTMPERKSFSELYLKKVGETFSQMLVRLIKESGQENATIYKRANIDRRLFSKIVNNKDYQPSKQTALAFAIALKLSYDKTQKLLESAGYILSKSLVFDIIVSYFIEHGVYDVDLINQQLYEHNQALLGC